MRRERVHVYFVGVVAVDPCAARAPIYGLIAASQWFDVAIAAHNCRVEAHRAPIHRSVDRSLKWLVLVKGGN